MSEIQKGADFTPQEGEVSFTLGGVDLKIKFGTQALIDLQEYLRTDEKLYTAAEIWAEAQQGRLKFIVAILWAGLRKYHPHYSQEDVANLCDKASIVEAQRLLGVIAGTNEPDPADVAELADAARPPAAQGRKTRARGTGGRSTSTRGAAA